MRSSGSTSAKLPTPAGVGPPHVRASWESCKPSARHIHQKQPNHKGHKSPATPRVNTSIFCVLKEFVHIISIYWGTTLYDLDLQRTTGGLTSQKLQMEPENRSAIPSNGLPETKAIARNVLAFVYVLRRFQVGHVSILSCFAANRSRKGHKLCLSEDVTCLRRKSLNSQHLVATRHH